jgi:uncharacterized membrane protein
MGTAIDAGTRSGERQHPGNGGSALPRVRPDARGRHHTPRANGNADGERLANFLGWFSIGLGLSELIAPGSISRLIGIRDDDRNRDVVRAMGLREITHGLGILSRPQSSSWVWSRVAGDAIDLSLLGKAMTASDGRGRTLAATAAVLGVTVLDVLAAQRLQRSAPPARGGVHVRKSVTINRTIEEVYDFWHDFENFPRFMRHLESVRMLDEKRSRWTATGPAGATVEWDAITTEDVPNEVIAWRSAENADVPNEGRVRFKRAPGDRGTEVEVELRYDPPGGHLAATFAKLFREEPSQQVSDDLRHFKQVMETGDIVVSDATVRRGMHPAQPDPRARESR